MRASELTCRASSNSVNRKYPLPVPGIRKLIFQKTRGRVRNSHAVDLAYINSIVHFRPLRGPRRSKPLPRPHLQAQPPQPKAGPFTRCCDEGAAPWAPSAPRGEIPAHAPTAHINPRPLIPGRQDHAGPEEGRHRTVDEDAPVPLCRRPGTAASPTISVTPRTMSQTPSTPTRHQRHQPRPRRAPPDQRRYADRTGQRQPRMGGEASRPRAEIPAADTTPSTSA